VSDVSERLAELRRRGLHRRMRVIEGAQGPRVRLDGAEVLLLCSNNYLGLAGHPRVRQAAAEAAERFGAGAGASRLISGSMSLHRRLEQRLAEFKSTRAALLFGSGYLANTGVVAALAGRDAVVFSDELNHASIIDGCRLSAAETFVYRHRDLEHLAHGLEAAGDRARLIVTDAVFSMDGDVAPLPELLELARRHGARLVVDEAHGTGALGPGGRGALAAAGLAGERDVVIVGTLGKALGGYGAYVCATAEIVDLLVNTARPFIFSTAPPPPSVGAALAALSLLASRPGLVEQLRRNAATLREALAGHGLGSNGSRSQIIPVLVGDPRRAVALCERVLERGVFAQAIRPPTVPPGSSRLRLTVMASHRHDELRAAAAVIAAAARELGVSGGSAGVAARRLRRAAA
jgi:8-amino-7-oxononanoate synthase